MENSFSFKSLFFNNVSLKQTIFKNTFWLFLAEVFETGIGFIVVVWLAREFGPELYGKWSFALSFVSIFAIIADFGFGTLIIREVARNKSKTAQYIDNIFLLKFILGLVTFFLIGLILSFINKDIGTIKLVYYLGAYIIINSFGAIFQSVFKANEKMEYETLCRIVQSLSRLGLVWLFIARGESIVYMGLAHVLSVLIGIVVSMIFVWYYFSTFFKSIDYGICKEILKEAWPFALGSLISVTYLRIGTIFLSSMKNDEAVGLYNASFGLVYTLSLLPNLFLTSVYPILSKYFAESSASLEMVYKKSFKFLFISAIILFPILFLGAGHIISIIYGQKYSGSVVIFRILLIAQFFSFLGCMFTYFLTAINKQLIHTNILAVILVANIALSFLLIPKYSYVGLGIALAATEILGFVLSYIYVRKMLKVLKLK